MKLYKLLFFLCWCFAISAQTITPQTQVSILTADGGDQIYSTFGHTAVRVWDTTQEIDLVYNYGTFDFGAPGFITNFINGKLDYYLNIEQTVNFIYNYQYQNRSVHEQVLNLDSAQKIEFINFLNWNAQLENRMYRYDFLFDNCATRVRDYFVKKDKEYKINYTQPEKGTSFRSLIHHYSYNELPWLDWGMDLLLGKGCDRWVSPKELTFLPDYILRSFELSKNIKLNTDLVSEKRDIYTAPLIQPQSHTFTPFLFNCILLILSLIIIAIEYKTRAHWKIWDALWMLILGLVGCLMLYEWFLTEHTVPKANFNLLWANPLFLVAIILLFTKSKQNAFKKWMMFIGGLLLSTQVFFFLMPQHYHTASYPIIWMILIRIAWLNFRNRLSK